LQAPYSRAEKASIGFFNMEKRDLTLKPDSPIYHYRCNRGLPNLIGLKPMDKKPQRARRAQRISVSKIFLNLFVIFVSFVVNKYAAQQAAFI
jgi:hypothetical protein